MLNLSQRATSLTASKIRDVAELGMGDPDVLPLWFGEAAWGTPDFAVRAAQTALEEGFTRYQPNNGVPALRQAAATYMGDLFNRAFDPSRITVTGSGMQGLALAAQALVEPGDRAVVVTPDWPNIAGTFAIAGAEVTAVALGVVEGRWSLDLDKLIAALQPGTKALILNSPNNPTGWTLSSADQEIVLQHCRSHGIWIVSDEVYNRLYRQGNFAPSFAQLAEPDDRLIIINSFSKSWAMTGWRLGWMLHPAELEQPLAMLTEFNMACTSGFVQLAGAKALSDGENFIAWQREQLAKSYNALASKLKAFPRLSFVEPDGAFYVFFKVEGMDDSLATAKDILAKTKVGLAPGIAFGPAGEGFMRLCYAQPEAIINEALTRLEAYFSA